MCRGKPLGHQAPLRAPNQAGLSAACLDAEAEHAALSAKIQTLEKKHALDMEQAQLKAKQEKLASAAELAVAEAKAKLLRQSVSGRSDSSHCFATSKSSSDEAQNPPASRKSHPTLKTPRKSKCFSMKTEP